MSSDDMPLQKSAVSRSDVAIDVEAGQQEDPENETTSLEVAQEARNAQVENGIDAAVTAVTADADVGAMVQPIAEQKPEVKFASHHTSINFDSKDGPSVTSEFSTDAVDDWELDAWHPLFEADRLVTSAGEETLVAKESKELEEKFTQTFFKCMTKLSNRKLMETINASVDHGDISLVFYCTSEELLRTFDNIMNGILNDRNGANGSNAGNED